MMRDDVIRLVCVSLWFASVLSCPNGDWAYCADESGSCTTTSATVVAFGASAEWSYLAVSAGTSICDSSVFGDASSASAGSRQCCELTNTGLAGSSPLSPVINEISCNSQEIEYFPSTALSPQPHYWRLELTEPQSVYATNCDSSADTQMQLLFEDGTVVGTGCDGDDCSGVCTTSLREEFTVGLQAGVYFIRTNFFGSQTGVYDLTVECSELVPFPAEVAGEVTCDSQTVDYLESTTARPRYWRFELTESSSVYFGNCDSDMDTKLYLYSSTGLLYDTGCDGDDCGNCWQGFREEFTVDLVAGVYYIREDTFGSTSSGNYRLDVNCASYGCVEYGGSLSTPHACLCQSECSGSFCNTRTFVENRLGDSTGVSDADLCQEGSTCCCSCQNCADYIAA